MMIVVHQSLFALWKVTSVMLAQANCNSPNVNDSLKIVSARVAAKCTYVTRKKTFRFHLCKECQFQTCSELPDVSRNSKLFFNFMVTLTYAFCMQQPLMVLTETAINHGGF